MATKEKKKTGTDDDRALVPFSTEIRPDQKKAMEQVKEKMGASAAFQVRAALDMYLASKGIKKYL